MSPNERRPGGEGEDRPKRNIGSGVGRAAASARRQAMRIALGHELIRVGRVLERRGMIVATEGNLSARLSQDRFLITRQGKRKGELTTRDFVELGIAEAEDSPARLAASTEHRAHAVAYLLRGDADALVHAHPVSLTAFAVRGVAPDFGRFDEGRDLIGAVGWVSYLPSGTQALADAVGRALLTPGRPGLLLLQNHGALAVGSSVDQALARLEMAERLATILLAAEGRS